jgi:hypothetical protein
MRSRSPLLDFLTDQESLARLDAEGWSLLFAEARSCGLLPRLACELEARRPVSMPANGLPQLVAARRQGESLAGDAMRELRHIDKALKGIKARTSVILLKGAAYVAADLPAARGRIFSDIDILVAPEFLAETEGALMLGGWAGRHLDAYDQRYYRQWSHEVPPMMHLQRGTTIDLHHSLVMPTCRIRVDSARMIREAAAIPDGSGWFRLKDEDLVLHAASHLLLNSEFDRGLRDLWDIDILLKHFGKDAPDFTDRVMARAAEVGLAEIARSALTLCHHFFGTPLTRRMEKARGVVIALLKCAASPRHPDTRPGWQGVADMLLLVRELSLRLPPHLLLRHLWHKTEASLKPQKDAP